MRSSRFDESCESGGGFDEACGEGVDMFCYKLRGERSEGGIASIDRPGVADDGDSPIAGKVGGCFVGELLVEGEVFCFDAELIVGVFEVAGAPGADSVEMVAGRW